MQLFYQGLLGFYNYIYTYRYTRNTQYININIGNTNKYIYSTYNKYNYRSIKCIHYTCNSYNIIVSVYYYRRMEYFVNYYIVYNKFEI